jgi:hypothetical protein
MLPLLIPSTFGFHPITSARGLPESNQIQRGELVMALTSINSLFLEVAP